MAGNTYVSDIREGRQIAGLFLVDNRSKRITKSNQAYLKFSLSDKSGGIEAVVWDEAMEKNPDAAKVEAGDYISLSGQSVVNRFTKRVEINIARLEIADEKAIKPEEFLPTTEKDIDELKADLTRLIGNVTDEHYRKLLEMLFDDQRFIDRYSAAPAAKNYHHAYLGGLLEHSVAVARLVELFCSQFYTDMDMSLLIAGALLHDVGKIREFDYSRKIDYSTEGRLKGHIVIGNEIVCEAIDKIEGFPGNKKLALSHIVLSHQGELEYGAAVRPKTKEAVILSIIDNIDAKMNGFLEIAKKYGDDTEWTEYQSMFSDFLYLGPKKIDEMIKQLKLVEEED